MSEPNDPAPAAGSPETAVPADAQRQPAAQAAPEPVEPNPRPVADSDIIDTSAFGPADSESLSLSPDAPNLAPEQWRSIVDQLSLDLEKLRSDAKSASLRHAADLDNLRKRLEREKEDAGKFAITKLATALIGVADNFERALAAVPAGAAETDPALKTLVEGVGMTERELKSILERHGVKRIWPEGEAFNPHQHQAVMQQDRTDVASGTILQVFQAGYLIEERVVRPAMVVVAKGGPKTAKADTAAGDQNGG
ncbi:MAG: nucleotide exchange factor GrpE [Hyphomicrobium sp.]|nr:nucleotide exchange factor GrpE [Hyphomicrobium sp.]